MTAMCHHAQYYIVLRPELKALCMCTLCIDRQLKIQGFNRRARTSPSHGKHVMECVLSADLRNNSNWWTWVTHSQAEETELWHQFPCAGDRHLLPLPYSAVCWCLLSLQNNVLVSPAQSMVAEWEPTVPTRLSCSVHLHWAAEPNYSLVSLLQLHHHHQSLVPVPCREGACSLKGNVDSNVYKTLRETVL